MLDRGALSWDRGLLATRSAPEPPDRAPNLARYFFGELFVSFFFFGATVDRSVGCEGRD
jgi:hypothetical protein